MINLVVGDWSADGHEKTETFVIESSIPAGQILEAYKAGVEILGFDLDKETKGYQCNTLSFENLRKLEAKGFNLNDLFDYKFYQDNPDLDQGQDFAIDSNEYVEIYLFIAKLGNPRFIFNFIKGNTLNIGGYGLFT